MLLCLLCNRVEVVIGQDVCNSSRFVQQVGKIWVNPVQALVVLGIANEEGHGLCYLVRHVEYTVFPRHPLLVLQDTVSSYRKTHVRGHVNDKATAIFQSLVYDPELYGRMG